MTELKLWFLKWVYPDNIVDQELGKVEFFESSITSKIKMYV